MTATFEYNKGIPVLLKLEARQEADEKLILGLAEDKRKSATRENESGDKNRKGCGKGKVSSGTFQ